MRKTYKKIKNASKAKIYRRKLSIRNKITGTTERPRICATKTNKNLYVQVIDDTKGETIVSTVTGHGLKDPKRAIEIAASPTLIDSSEKAVLNAIDNLL